MIWPRAPFGAALSSSWLGWSSLAAAWQPVASTATAAKTANSLVNVVPPRLGKDVPRRKSPEGSHPKHYVRRAARGFSDFRADRRHVGWLVSAERGSIGRAWPQHP